MLSHSVKNRFLGILFSCLILITFSACSFEKDSSTSIARERYFDMVELLSNYDEFADSSSYYDVTLDIAKISDGYRFYIIIDNPKVSMYDIEAVAIEKGIDYSQKMAANIGIFEEEYYSMVPNQCNTEKGFVKGVSISGVTTSLNGEFYLLVQWNNSSMSHVHREFIRLKGAFEENHE